MVIYYVSMMGLKLLHGLFSIYFCVVNLFVQSVLDKPTSMRTIMHINMIADQ